MRCASFIFPGSGRRAGNKKGACVVRGPGQAGRSSGQEDDRAEGQFIRALFSSRLAVGRGVVQISLFLGKFPIVFFFILLYFRLGWDGLVSLPEA